MNKTELIEKRKIELVEVKTKIKELQKRRKFLYNYLYINKWRENNNK